VQFIQFAIIICTASGSHQICFKRLEPSKYSNSCLERAAAIGSSSSMLQFLGWNSLEERRGQYSLVMMYKIVHGLVVIPTTPYLLPASYGTCGHSSKFLVPSTRVNAFRYSYFPATIMSWNGLPAHIIQSLSVECFKSRMAKFRLTPTST